MGAGGSPIGLKLSKDAALWLSEQAADEGRAKNRLLVELASDKIP